VRTLSCPVLRSAVVLMTLGLAAAQGREGIPAAVLVRTPPSLPFLAASVPLSDVTERLMSFDNNKDHLVSRDELPERMKGLIERGDRNADAALDLEEMGPLVNTEAPARIRGASRPQPSQTFAGIISDLKLSPAKRERALAIINASKATRNGNDPTHRDLYTEMRSILDDEEYGNFVAAAARLNRRFQEMIRRFQ
jgi:hypothetical protein